MGSPTVWTPCAAGCAGWFLSGETYLVERCDECDRFRDDAEAAEHVATFGWQDDARQVQPDRLRELVSAARLVAYPDGHISPEDAARFKAAVDAWDDLEV